MEEITGYKKEISSYIKKYNQERPHSAHGILTPDEVYRKAA